MNNKLKESSYIININKPLGITSYDVIRQLKPKFNGKKIGHAGTLDPLANGVLIILVGKNATKKQSEFMNVDKTYEFEVLFGFETDTYDILGMILNSKKYEVDEIKEKVEPLLNNYVGEINQKVPPFSAVKIKGKPLYRWYLDGNIDKVEIPTKTIKINKIEIVNSRVVSKNELKKEVMELLETVKSGFRQKQIIEKWNSEFDFTKQDKFLVIKVRSDVSKGTYVRAIANDLGKKLGVGACTLTITRTRVGKYKIEDSIQIADIKSI